jgi:predicted RNA methylase
VAAPAPAITPLAEPGPLRPQASPLPAGFPRLGLYVITYAGNENSLAPTLASLRASDWKEEPVVFVQPADWPRSKESASRNYRRALEQAAADGCDFAVILEDDVRVGRWFRQNLTANPLIRRDQCDYLGLFMPDLIASPWDRAEVPLGYRLARPLYSGPNRLWEKHRIWGSQGYALSRRLVLAALERWQRLAEGQDTRVISVCSELKVPLWYTAPCLIEHAPLRSEFNTPAARAVDFDPGFRLEPDPGFQPPEAVPGWLTVVEGRALWTAAAGRQVLELGTGCGRATVCLAQSAQQVLSVDIQNQAVAAEWVRRYGAEDRVEFRQDDAGNLKQTLAGKRFGLAFIDTEHDAQSVRRDLESVLGFLEPGGLLAFHDYPDPGWPDVRRVVDEYVVRCGWERVAQADYLGLFRTK